MKITCEKCSAPYEIEDSRIPVSGFIMKCPACMHSFKVMRAGDPPAAAPPPPVAPPPPAAAGARYHVRRRTGKTFGPFVESAIVSMLQNGKLDGDEQVSLDAAHWQPLSAIPAFAAWAKTGAAARLDDLPAPKGPSPAGIVDLPAPKRPTPSALGIPDLPTPKRPMGGAGIADLPTPKRPPGGAGIPDLPAPKGPSPTALGIPDLPAPKGPSPMARGIPDLPAPKGPSPTGLGIPDLPAPKGPAPRGGPPRPAGIVDLPAPKGPPGITDLPTPKKPAGIVDLPAPKGPPGITDLPTPKGPAGIPDLPMPKRPAGVTDLPAPKATAMGVGPARGLDDFDIAPGAGGALDLGEVDLPTPKGGLDLDSPLPPPPMGDDDGAAAIISSPGEEMQLSPSDIDLVAPRGQSNQLHVDLDAIDEAADPSLDVVAPRAMPAPEAPPAEDLPMAQPVSAPPRAAPRRQAAKAAPVEAPVSAAPTERKRKVVMAIAAGAGLVIAAIAIGVFKFTGVVGEKIDAAALAKLRAEIADDNYGTLTRIGLKLKASAEAQPKALDQRAMAAEVLSLAVVAHRGEPRLGKMAGELMDPVDKSSSNPEAIKGRAAAAMAAGRYQEAESQLGQILGGDKPSADAMAQLLLGWTQLRGNRAKSAEASFQKALQLDPKLASAAWGMAQCRDKAGDAAGMKSWLDKTLQVSPNHFAAQLAQARDKGEDTIQGLIQLGGTRGSPAELADAWAMVGARQLADLRLDDAESSYKKALASDAMNAAALRGMGQTLYALGRMTESKEKLDAAQRLAPNDVDVIVALARTQLALGQPILVQEMLANAAKVAPKDARIKLLQGKAEESLDKEGAPERAAALYRQAIDLDPKLIEAYSSLAQQALKVGRPDTAQALASDAAKAAGDTADVRVLAGVVLLAQNDPAKAQAEFQKALDKVPNHLDARFQLAAALEAQKKPDAALAELEKIRAKVPSYPGLSQRLGALYQALGRIDDAGKAYDNALKMPGAGIPLKFAAASFYHSVKKCERAREITEAITNEDPKDADAQELLARVWDCLGKPDLAMQAIKHAIEISNKPQYHLTKCKLHEKLNQGNEAMSECQDAADRGHIPEAYITRAKLLLGYGSTRDALHDLDLALKLDKTRYDAVKLQGRGLLLQRQFKAAEGKLKEASARLPKDAYAKYWLGEACTGASDFGCARAAYREAAQLTGLEGDDRGDAWYKVGMAEKQVGNQSAAGEAFKKCIEVGSDVLKANCGKELTNLGGFK